MLTVIIPTSNRPDFLVRVLSYYRDQHFNHRLLIADSSDPNRLTDTECALKALRADLHIAYKTYSPDRGFAEKLSDALRYVSTPYAVLGADDDFFVPSALDRGVEFLRDHPDYAVAHGKAAIFTVRSGTAHGPLEQVGRYSQRAIEDATGAQRLLNHLEEYSTTWYSVAETDRLRGNLERSSDLGEAGYFNELLPTCLSVVQGKAKKLDALYMVRQAHPGMTSAHAGRQRDIFEWIAGSSWPDHYRSFRDCLAKALVRQDGIGMERARAVVKQAFWAYLVSGMTREWQERCGSARAGKWRGLAQRIPGARRAWRWLNSMVPGEELSPAALLRALLHPFSRYPADFMPIYRAITSRPADVW